MTAWRWVRLLLGMRGVVIVVLATLGTGLVAAVVAPRLILGSVQAEGRVSLTTVTGTRASYELATYVADFQAALAADHVKRVAAQAAGVAGTESELVLSSERLGDSTTVLVRFVGPSEKAADGGMRAAVRAGLNTLVDDARRRAQLQVSASLDNQRQVLRAMVNEGSFADLGGPKEYTERSRDILVQRAAEGVADAQGQAVLAQAQAQAVDGAVRSQRVSFVALPTTSVQLRIVLAASATAFVLSLAGVLLSRRAVISALQRGPVHVDDVDLQQGQRDRTSS